MPIHDVERVRSFKLLRVTTDQDLKMVQCRHVNAICPSASIVVDIFWNC